MQFKLGKLSFSSPSLADLVIVERVDPLSLDRPFVDLHCVVDAQRLRRSR